MKKWFKTLCEDVITFISPYIKNDETWIRFTYFLSHHRSVNLKAPKRFNDKLQWLLLNYHDWSYTDMVDKYRVKPIVAKIIGENHIIPTYGAWDSFDKIDFDSLPDQFVLKCNHDSGGLVICTDKSKLDKNAARKKIMKSLKKNFYYRTREYAYKNVKPVVLAEKYMVDDTGWQLKDYKVFCFNGEPTYIEVDYDRFVGHKLNVYDLNWNFVDFYMTSKNDPNANIKKPAKFETMIEMARKLAKGTPFVRVDFYINQNDEIFFGEMTYTPGTGHIHFTPDDWDFKLGELLILPEKKRISQRVYFQQKLLIRHVLSTYFIWIYNILQILQLTQRLMKKILAVASIGGHWVQLLRITRPLEEHYEVVYMSTHPKCKSMVGTCRFHTMMDFSRWDAWKMLPASFNILGILLKERPAAIVTTGAAPGLLTII